MVENVTISYRGPRYELGRGPRFYGIWVTGAPRSQPLEWWPDTPEGWAGAWARFNAIEAPGTIVPVSQPGTAGPAAGVRALAAAAGPRGLAGAALLAAGVILGVAGLFPVYTDGSSLASAPGELAAHVIYLAAWAACTWLICLGGSRLRAGALAGAGIAVVTFGLFVADIGTVIASGTMGPGLALSLIGWLAAAAGSVTALGLAAAARAARSARPARRHGAEAGALVMLLLAGLGTAAAFAPAWDSYILRTAAGATQKLTAGNAFGYPAPIIVGNVAAMAGLVLVVLAAGLWRPVREGAALLAGAVIVMVAQAISALVQVTQPTPPGQFGVSPGEASALGLTISNGLTPAFWIYCVFLAALVLAWARMFTLDDSPLPDAPLPVMTSTAGDRV